MLLFYLLLLFCYSLYTVTGIFLRFTDFLMISKILSILIQLHLLNNSPVEHFEIDMLPLMILCRSECRVNQSFT